MYKNILVPVDLADIERGKASLDLAKAIGGDDCKITILNVAERIPAYIEAELPQDLREKTILNARTAVEDLASAAGGCAAQIKTGRSYNVILSTAEEMGADLIIIGSHRPGLQDYLLGSTAARVVRHSKCSVLVSR
ncbi:MAG: universal stress protein [Pseudomonadota bacterium]